MTRWTTSPAYPWTAALLLLASALWAWTSAPPPGTTTSGEIPAPHAGFLAPDFTLQTPAGQTYTLSDLRGRPVVINLWASWCGPCRAEMPALEAVYQAYKGQGLVILGVNATRQDSIPAALAFVQALGLTFPILLDVDGRVSEAYELRALPSTFFVRPDGTIAEVVVGGPMAEALLRTRVEALLKEAP